MSVDGIAVANYLLTRLGNSYADEDCVKAVVVNPIRKLPGGDPSYRTAGCTELWNSINSSGKYRHITKRMTLAEAQKEGLLIGDLPVIYSEKTGKCEHIAYYMGGIGGYECIHSSASKGCVCGTTLKNGFTHVLRHRDIVGVRQNANEEATEMVALYKMRVELDSGCLNLRNGPSADSRDIGDIPNGAMVEVLVEGDWPFIRHNGKSGYVSGKYLRELSEEEIAVEETVEDDAKWGVFIPCKNQEQAEMFAQFFNVCVVCQREVID